MVCLGGGALTAEFGDELTGDLRTALLRSESTPYQLRLALAEQAAGWGQISGGDLRALYQNITVGEDQLDNVLAVAKTEADAHASGLLFRAAEAQGSDVTRAMYIDHAITLARSRGTVRAAGGPLAELVGAMTPASHLQWFTPTAVEILIAGGGVLFSVAGVLAVGTGRLFSGRGSAPSAGPLKARASAPTTKSDAGRLFKAIMGNDLFDHPLWRRNFPSC